MVSAFTLRCSPRLPAAGRPPLALVRIGSASLGQALGKLWANSGQPLSRLWAILWAVAQAWAPGAARQPQESAGVACLYNRSDPRRAGRQGPPGTSSGIAQMEPCQRPTLTCSDGGSCHRSSALNNRYFVRNSRTCDGSPIFRGLLLEGRRMAIVHQLARSAACFSGEQPQRQATSNRG